MRSLLLFSVLLSLSRYFSTLSLFANADLVNQTIDDADIRFSYFPFASWRPSHNASCVTCLQPDFSQAINKTLHYAIHASGPDADDAPKSSSLFPSPSQASVPPSPPSPSPSASSPLPSPSSTVRSSSQALSSSLQAMVAAASTTSPSITAPRSGSTPSPTSTDDSSGKGGGHGHSRRELAKFRRTDADDPNFVDVNMTATINFTGSAIYVFCAVPTQINNASILGLTNLAFFLDDLLIGNYTHNARLDTDSNTNFQYKVMVFSNDTFAYGPHVFVIKPALGSMVLLDSVQYSTLDTTPGTNGTGSATPQATPSGYVSSASSGSSKKNTATFGIALGSSMGVLAVLAFAVFLSICMRRRKSAKWDKEREAKEAAMRSPSPEMSGPRPFIPRYFPGNIPPPSPSLPPFSLLSITSSSGEESGPSHGLDFPPAPGHLDAPAYSPPPLVLSEMARVPASLPPPARLPLVMEEVELPQYNDVGRTPLVSIPALTQRSARPPAVGLPPSSPPPWGTEGGASLQSSSLAERFVVNEDSTAGRTNISQIHTNPDEQPG